MFVAYVNIATCWHLEEKDLGQTSRLKNNRYRTLKMPRKKAKKTIKNTDKFFITMAFAQMVYKLAPGLNRL